MAKLLVVFGFVGLGTGEVAFADAWGDLFKAASVSREDLKFNDLNQQQFGFTQGSAPFFLALHGQPLAIPSYARIFREVTLSLIDKPDELLSSGLARLGVGIRRTLASDPFKSEFDSASKPSALFDSIASLHRAAKKPLTSGQVEQLKTKIKTLPADVQPSVAYLISVMAKSVEWHRRAFEKVSAKDLAAGWTVAKRNAETDPSKEESLSDNLKRLKENVNFLDLMVGGLDIAYGVRRSKELLPKEIATRKFRMEWLTPLGWIVIGDADKSVYDKKPSLLIYDFGGDDTYHTGAGTTPDMFASVIVDVAGNDSYIESGIVDANVTKSENRKKTELMPVFGGGLFGYAVLADFAGDDTYRSFRQTQGRGFFGLGLLWDESGDDVYDSYAFAQGSGELGIGILLDKAGKDQYLTFHQSQGFGSIYGVGYLIDAQAGDDIYLANDQQIEFPALVDAKRNHSMSQGVGFGYRGDLTDGYSISGGVGVLLDEGGNNTYTADFFSQGSAYWYGVGLLISGEGHDTYVAGKYAQGASAHFGVGVLLDRGGDDKYKVAQELGIGHGHDYGIGFFVDESGSDRYEAPELSLGCASAQGRGFFWDKAGDDVYIAPKQYSLGCALYRIPDEKTFRRRDKTIGLFLDTGGKNKFETEITGLRKVSTSGQ